MSSCVDPRDLETRASLGARAPKIFQPNKKGPFCSGSAPLAPILFENSEFKQTSIKAKEIVIEFYTSDYCNGYRPEISYIFLLVGTGIIIVLSMERHLHKMTQTRIMS